MERVKRDCFVASAPRNDVETVIASRRRSNPIFLSKNEQYIFFAIAAFSLIFGIYLRFRGIGWGIIDLPWYKATYHFDEHKVLDTIRHFKPFHWGVHDFRLGTFHFYLVAAALKIAEWVGYISFFHHNEFDATKVFVVGRLVSVIFGLMTIPLVYLTGNKIGGFKVGLLSAAVFSLLPLHVLNSHFLAPDVSMCFFVMLAFYITLLSHEKESMVLYALQGLFCGLAVATKYSAAPIAIVIVISHFLQKDVSWKTKAVAYPFIILGFFIGEPYALVYFNEFRKNISGMSTSHTSGEQGLLLTIASNIRFYIKNIALYSMSIPLFVTSLLGLQRLLQGKSPVSILTFSSIVAFTVFALISQFQFIRFSLPIIIFLCIPCAIGLVNMKRPRSRYVRITLCVVFPFVACVRNVNIMTEEHTATSAYNWIDENVEPGSSLFQEWREVPPVQPRRYLVYGYNLVDPKIGFKIKPDYIIRTDLTPLFDNKHVLEQLNRHYKLLVTIDNPYYLFIRKNAHPEKGTFFNNDPYILNDMKSLSHTIFLKGDVPQDLKYTHPKIAIYGRLTTLASLTPEMYSVNHSQIDFKDASSQRYLRRGWSKTEDYGTWAVGKESVIITHFEEPKNYIMRIKATPYTVPNRKQSVKVFVNDEFIGEYTFTKQFLQWETFDVKIPAKYLTPGTTKIKFLYRHAISPKEINNGPDIRKLSVAFESIKFIKS